MNQVTIAGAGLAGTLLALLLAKRGYTVELLESREDIRKENGVEGRSINLALSCRGITALKAAGIMEKVDQIRVPMRARAIHEPDGSIKYQPFGRHPEEYINSISRKALNSLLLDEAENSPYIQLYFGWKVKQVDFANKKLSLVTSQGEETTRDYVRLIGADGAASKVRESMKNQGIIEADRQFLTHGYKELCISLSHGTTLAREHLHLWPRGECLLLGNPNPDDSITGTLFLAMEGENSFANLNNPAQVEAFFARTFSDAKSIMPDLVHEFFSHPTGNLSTVRAHPWYYEDDCILIGDAAHGVVPFFGQGMNAAFEDCRLFSEMLQRYEDDWSRFVPAFYQERKLNTDAIADLSMENYHEIQVDIMNPHFLLQKQVEKEIMKRYPDNYVSMHAMVMFTNIPYSLAKAHYGAQKAMLEEICLSIESIQEVSWEKVENLIANYDKNLTHFMRDLTNPRF